MARCHRRQAIIGPSFERQSPVYIAGSWEYLLCPTCCLIYIYTHIQLDISYENDILGTLYIHK